HLLHARFSRSFVGDAGPLIDQLEEHRPLFVIHRGGFQPLGRDFFFVLSGTHHEISDAVIQDSLFALIVGERLKKRQTFVTLGAEWANCLTVEYEKRGLRSGQAGREHAVATRYGDVEREMMTSKLEHPRTCLGRRADKRNVVGVAAEHGSAGPAATWIAALAAAGALPRLRRGRLRWRTTRTGRRRTPATRPTLRPVGLEVVVGLANLLHFFEAARAEHDCEQIHRGGLLLRRHVFEGDTAARHEAGGKIGPASA